MNFIAHSARLVPQFGSSIVPSSHDKARSITMVNFNDYSADIKVHTRETVHYSTILLRSVHVRYVE